MNELERKLRIKETFNTVAEGYDSRALRFFSASAKYLANCLKLSGEEQVLDVATGTGNTALELARHLPHGRVTGVDFSGGMLAQARAKAAANGLGNLLFQEMDMQVLTFPDNEFDVATCAFGIFFVEDMDRQLSHIAEKVKPKGRVAILGFHDGTFTPAIDPFFRRLDLYGIERPPLSWRRIGTEEKVRSLYQNGGLKNIRIERMEVGYPVTPEEWWDIIWNAGFRNQVNQLSPQNMEKFKGEHLSEIRDLSTEGSVRLNIEILCAIGEKPQV